MRVGSDVLKRAAGRQKSEDGRKDRFLLTPVRGSGASGGVITPRRESGSVGFVAVCRLSRQDGLFAEGGRDPATGQLLVEGAGIDHGLGGVDAGG